MGLDSFTSGSESKKLTTSDADTVEEEVEDRRVRLVQSEFLGKSFAELYLRNLFMTVYDKFEDLTGQQYAGDFDE